MMRKEKYQLEYVFDKVSKRSLWNQLSTPPGLSAWFCDDVMVSENVYTFIWNKAGEEAEIVSQKPESSIRYRWLESENDSYFEFVLHTVELTGATALEIIDFAEPDEKEDAIGLWDSQIEVLKRTLGI